MKYTEDIPLSIKYVLEKTRSKKKPGFFVYARIVHKREKAMISMNILIDEKEWDSVNECLFPTKKFNLVQNHKIQEMTQRILNVYREMSTAELPISVKSIKRALTGEANVSGNIGLMEYYEKYLSEIRLRPAEYGEGVIGHYIKTRTHLTRFLILHGWVNIKLNDLSCSFLERFEFYLLSTPHAVSGRPMNVNTMITYVRKLKAITNSALRKQIISSNPFASFKMKPLKPVNKVTLTKEERQKLREHSLGENPSLQRVRDCFLFCCETGLRHSDAVQLTADMISFDDDGRYWITLRMIKTKDNLDIPMTKAAFQIYEKFESYRKSTGKVLPMLPNQTVNAHLKTIAQLAGINKRLSFHVSRHTFGTSLLEDGVDIASVSALMGHRSIKTTQIYSKVTRTRKSEVVRYLDERRQNG